MWDMTACVLIVSPSSPKHFGSTSEYKFSLLRLSLFIEMILIETYFHDFYMKSGVLLAID